MTAAMAVARSDLRWCSDGFEIGCDNGERLRIVFTLDCCDREAISWVATTGSINSSDVCDLMIESVERRFGLVSQLPAPIEWLSDNGSPYTARGTRRLARDIGLVPCTTPVESPQSNGMAEEGPRAICHAGTRLRIRMELSQRRAPGSSYEAALAMYLALTSGASRRAALNPAAQTKLSNDKYTLFLRISKYSTPSQQERNDLFHGLWGFQTISPMHSCLSIVHIGSKTRLSVCIRSLPLSLIFRRRRVQHAINYGFSIICASPRETVEPCCKGWGKASITSMMMARSSAPSSTSITPESEALACRLSYTISSICYVKYVFADCGDRGRFRCDQ
jgi:transposase InsO family protein